MQPATKVLPGFESYEVVYAKDQPGVSPLSVIKSPEGILLSRWEFTDEERRAIAAGSDLLLFVHTINKPLQLYQMAVGHVNDPQAMIAAAEILDLPIELE